MSWAAVVGTTIAAGASIHSGNKAEDAAYAEGQRVDQLERERFAEAKRQADLLRQEGSEAEAVALEEATRAEFGAEKFESLSNMYAERAEQASQTREIEARNLYDRIQGRSQARETAGERGAANILSASERGGRALDDATGMANARLDDAFAGIEERYSPYLESERTALGQLNAEFGLGPGETSTVYRDSPAYAAALDASEVAQSEAIDTINQDAANSGNLYSGSRGEALVDRSTRGSYERAGIEQSYYQNYINMLRDLSQPTATSALSNYQAGFAGQAGQNYLDSARTQYGADLNAATAAESLRLNSMRTGDEGSYLINALPTGTEGAEYRLGGANLGTAGSPYRMSAAQIPLDTQAYAGGLITGNAPQGLPGANLRLEGVGAKNAAVSDLVSGGAQIYSNYLSRPQPVQTPKTPYYGYGT